MSFIVFLRDSTKLSGKLSTEIMHLLAADLQGDDLKVSADRDGDLKGGSGRTFTVKHPWKRLRKYEWVDENGTNRW